MDNLNCSKRMLLRVFLFLVLSACQSAAQGTIYFQNRGGPGYIDFKIGSFDSSGQYIGALAGPGWSAQLWAGTSQENLVPGYPITTFRTGNAAGYVHSVFVTVPGVPGDVHAFVQIRAWNNNHGQVLSWAEAIADPTIERGVSSVAWIGPLGSATHWPAHLQNTPFDVFPSGERGIGSPLITNNIFHFTVVGEFGQLATIEASTSLASGSWTTFAEALLPSQMMDPDSADISQRFYRLQGPGSDQVIGFVKLTLAPGLNMIANQLHRGDHTLKRLIPVAPDGTQFYKYATGSGWTSYTYDDFAKGWLPDGNVTLNRGEGGFLRNNTSSNLVVSLVGRVFPPEETEIPAGFSIRSVSMPVNDLSSLVGCIPPNTQLFRYSHGTGYISYIYDDLAQGWIPSEPQIEVGEAFFLRTETSTHCLGYNLFAQ
jgi:hypothetical protein